MMNRSVHEPEIGSRVFADPRTRTDTINAGGSMDTSNLTTTKFPSSEFGMRLRQMSTRRGSIRALMIHCLDNSADYVDWMSLIFGCITIDVEAEIARLYLLSDLIYNVSKADDARFDAIRASIEQGLPDLLHHLRRCNLLYRADIQNANRLQDRVTRVLLLWQKWGIFASSFLLGLWSIWEGSGLVRSGVDLPINEEVCSTRAHDPPDDEEEESNLDGEPIKLTKTELTEAVGVSTDRRRLVLKWKKPVIKK